RVIDANSRAGSCDNCTMQEKDSRATVAGRTSMTRGDRRFRNASLALFAAGFATFASVYCVQPLMPLLSAHFHVTPAVSSLSLSITTGLLAFSILFTGLVSEAINRKRLMGWCLAASSLLCVLGALAPNWPVLLLLR